VGIFLTVICDDSRITAELASKASNMTTMVEYRTEKCEHTMPDKYFGEHPLIDWSFAKGCTGPCSCAPTSFADCAETMPVPGNATYALDCQRWPLGTGRNNFADCNSIRRDPRSQNAYCFEIDAGEIVESNKCKGSWINATFAAACCGPANAATKNRTGRLMPPASRSCSAFFTSADYVNKCHK
jgi:hypothetical protein